MYRACETLLHQTWTEYQLALLGLARQDLAEEGDTLLLWPEADSRKPTTPMDFECPYCHAEKGRWCKQGFSGRRKKPHHKRAMLAARKESRRRDTISWAARTTENLRRINRDR